MDSDDKNNTLTEAEAERLLIDLSRTYSDFMNKNAEQRQPNTRRITRLFAGWFMGYNPLSVNPDDQAFLDEVERITAQFVPMLEEMKVNNPDACMGYAAKAVDVLLTQKPAKEKTAGDWYLTVAEYQISFLLPYLSCNELKNTREKLLKRTRKRLMFPKQLELIRLIDKLLKP